MALAIKMLHFKCFLLEHGPLSQSFMDALEIIHSTPTPNALEKFETSADYKKVMQMYEEFNEKTRKGAHGATAQYWIMYVDLLDLHQRFSRAVRTNDVDFFIYCLGKMCSIFFSTNHPNYARYMVRYQLNLLNIDPCARDILLSGGLSVRRSSKEFTRTAVDLTLEQTINANAASRRSGISAFTTNYSARRRWMTTHATRSTILGHLFDIAGLQKLEDTTRELEHSSILRDNNDLQKVIDGIVNTLNPFDAVYADENLYCLSTGKPTSPDIKTELLHCVETG